MTDKEQQTKFKYLKELMTPINGFIEDRTGNYLVCSNFDAWANVYYSKQLNKFMIETHGGLFVEYNYKITHYLRL